MKAKSLRRIFCMLLTVAMLLTFCPITASAAAKLKLNYSSYSMVKGTTVTLKANLSKVTWSSSNKNIASVTSAGKVTAKKAGTCYITAKAGSQTAKCKITVINGKITLSKSTLNLEEGQSAYVTATVKGSHTLSLVYSNKAVANVSSMSTWSGDKIKFKITAYKAGKATIKVRMKNATEVSKTITVNVSPAEQEIEGGNDEPADSTEPAKTTQILTGTNSVNVEKGKTVSFEIYSDNTAQTEIVSSDPKIATVSEPSWGSNGYATITVTGVSHGTATITISAKDNTALKRTVTVSVSADGYYMVSNTVPSKKLYTDIIAEWVYNGKTYYMLVPYGYDEAHANTLFSKETGSVYYKVYEEVPSKLAIDDQTAQFRHTIEGNSVTRYILLPANYDPVRNSTASAVYTNKYNYWTIYNSTPVRTSSTDVIKNWQASVDGVLYTRSILLPAGYDETQLKQIIDNDAGNNDTYYTVSISSPQRKANGDIVYQFYANGRNLFILLPENFDPIKRDSAVAKYTGNFSYYTIYSTKPEKLISTDIIKEWTKIVDRKQETRYMLLPAGYSESLYNSIRNSDMNGENVYYIVSDTPPVNVTSSDTVYQWYNQKAKAYRYMLLPQNPDVLKRNNTVYADTGVFEYYTAYSVSPESGKRSPDDQIKIIDNAVYGRIYILVPKDYDQKELEKAMNLNA